MKFGVVSAVINELKMFEKRMLRQILQPKRDLVTGDWKRLCNEESHNM